jgi:hypothetical protein
MAAKAPVTDGDGGLEPGDRHLEEAAIGGFSHHI